MKTRIERLDESNTKLLERVAPDVFDYPVQPEHLARFVADARHVMFLAVADDQVIGMASGVEYFHPDKPPQFWINEIGVAPEYRNRGAGRSLTRALIDEARRRGCVFAWLGTAQDNVAAQACFNAIADDDPPEAFLLYEWDLTP